MEPDKVKQAFKESILFRENALATFEEKLAKKSFAEASKILETFKVSSLGKLKEQVIAGDTNVEALKEAVDSEEELSPAAKEKDSEDNSTEAVDGDVANSPAEAEEGKNTDPNPTAGENRTRIDDKETSKETADNDDDDESETSSEATKAKNSFEEKVLKSLSTINERITAVEAVHKEELIKGANDSAIANSPAEGEEGKNTDPNPTAGENRTRIDDKETSKETADNDEDDESDDDESETSSETADDLTDDEMPTPPAIAENVKVDNKASKTNKESVDASFNNLFKN